MTDQLFNDGTGVASEPTPVLTGTVVPTTEPVSTGQSLAAVSPASAQDHAPVVTGEMNLADYVFVTVNGQVVAVPKSQIQPETAVNAVTPTVLKAVEDPHWYVHLADGKVLRVKQSDLPPSAGSNAPFGYWHVQDGNDVKVYTIIGIFPVEDVVKGNAQ